MPSGSINDYRLFLFSGHYGSGKSEISVNFALRLARRHRTAIVDFDIINPYFRTADAREALEKQGVRVIAPVYAKTNVDVPALPAEISSLFDDKGVRAVFDVGGDPAGARAVSRYREEFMSDRTAHLYVFNLRRPMTATTDMIAEMFRNIQDTSRLPFTALVGNTNLLRATGAADLLAGLDAAVELSLRLSLPIAFCTYMAPDGAHIAPNEDETAQQYFSRARDLGIEIFSLAKHIYMG